MLIRFLMPGKVAFQNIAITNIAVNHQRIIQYFLFPVPLTIIFILFHPFILMNFPIQLHIFNAPPTRHITFIKFLNPPISPTRRTIFPRRQFIYTHSTYLRVAMHARRLRRVHFKKLICSSPLTSHTTFSRIHHA